MDVSMEIALESPQLRHAHGVGRAAIVGRDEPIGQLAHGSKSLGGIAMLALHHPNRILDGPERAGEVSAVGPGLRQLLRVREQDELLLEEMLLEVDRQHVEQARDAFELRVPRTVHLDQLREVAANQRQRGADVRMVRRHDVIDQSVDRPLGHVVLRIARRSERRECVLDVGRIRCCRSTRLLEWTAAPAAEVDAELFEHGGRAEIGRDNVADGRRGHASVHDRLQVSVRVATSTTGRYDAGHMQEAMADVLRRSTLFRRLSTEDRQRLAAVAKLAQFDKGAPLFNEGDGSDRLYTVLSGRVKVFKVTARGTDVILEIFGPGDSVGAVAVYESRPYPASAVALEETTCVVMPRQAFFELLETYPSIVRGLLVGLTHRLVELTNRLTELSGGRVEGRLSRFFLKLATEMGQARPDGTFIPLSLSRQELADMIGTTIETSIRIMSRWGKEDVVRTEKDGFYVVDRDALEAAALT